MYDTISMRFLTIKDYEHPMHPDSLRIVATFWLPGGMLDAIPQKIFEELAQSGIVGYEISDLRRIEAMGAGHSAQEVLLTLASGAAEGAASASRVRLCS